MSGSFGDRPACLEWENGRAIGLVILTVYLPDLCRFVLRTIVRNVAIFTNLWRKRPVNLESKQEHIICWNFCSISFFFDMKLLEFSCRLGGNYPCWKLSKEPRRVRRKLRYFCPFDFEVLRQFGFEVLSSIWLWDTFVNLALRYICQFGFEGTFVNFGFKGNFCQFLF